jgi:6-phosphogluconolactonase
MARVNEETGAGTSEVRIFDDGGELMRAAAEAIVGDAARAVAERGRFDWALAGGSTPRALYRLLADDPYRVRLPWSAIHFYWGDERHVPPDHADSNYRMAREAMLDRVPVPAENVHRIPAERPDAAAAAAEYEATLRAIFAVVATTAGEWPRFDLVQLGLGPEGHTASLFPGSPLLAERTRWVAAPWVEAQHTFRITLTPPVLNHARRAMFLVSGDEKAAALHAVLQGAREPEVYPAQIVEGNRLWLVDRAAARLL